MAMNSAWSITLDLAFSPSQPFFSEALLFIIHHVKQVIKRFSLLTHSLYIVHCRSWAHNGRTVMRW